jgi:zinc protease
VAEVEKALEEEIERLQKEPVEQRELEKVKNQLESSFIYSQDSLFFQAMLLARYEIAQSWKVIDQYLPLIRRVTAQDIQRVARQYLIPDNRTVGTLIPLPPKPGQEPPLGPSGRDRIIR